MNKQQSSGSLEAILAEIEQLTEEAERVGIPEEGINSYIRVETIRRRLARIDAERERQREANRNGRRS